MGLFNCALYEIAHMTVYKFDAGLLRFLLMCHVPTDPELNTPNIASTAIQPFNLWGHIAPLQASDRWVSAQGQNIITHNITIRWMKHINPQMQIVHNDQLFHIINIYDPDGRENWLVLQCGVTQL